MPCKHVVVLMVFLNSILNTAATCDGVIQEYSEKNQPIFLKKDNRGVFTFILPDQQFLFHEGEGFVLSCPNPRNFLNNTNANISEAICRKGKFKVDNKTYDDINKLQCKKFVRGDIKPTNEKCGNNEGYIINIGYYVASEKFVTLIEICYDGVSGNSLYADHKILGKSIRYKSRSKVRPGFSSDGLGPRISASVAYKNAFQKSTFNKLLGSPALANLYINNGSYLSRGHLAPDADFHFAAWQYSTYFYINTSPQWQAINGGNWKKIESMVRTTAANTGQSIRVFTGTYEVLTLPDDNNNMQRMFLLSDERLPVPKYFWKIVYINKKAVVIIILNNPFVKVIDPDDYLCKCICAKNGWWHDSWNIPKKGLVHCCDYKEFSKIVHTIPALNVNGTFIGLNFL